MARPLVLQLSLIKDLFRGACKDVHGRAFSMTDQVEHSNSLGHGREEPFLLFVVRIRWYRQQVLCSVPGGPWSSLRLFWPLQRRRSRRLVRVIEDKAPLPLLSQRPLQVLVGLFCTMCPDVVVAAQRIAADNPQVTCDAPVTSTTFASQRHSS